MKNKDFLKLLFVGDIFPADLDFNIGFGIKSLFDQHQGNLWKPVLSALFKNADLVIGNLESPLIPEAIKAKGSFYGSPVFASFLKESGVTTLNIANNHILEQDDKGFESTLKELHQNQIDVIGSIENNQQKIVYKNMEGIKIAIAGFCNVDVLPDYHHKYFAVLNEENVFSALQEMKSNNIDIKILSFHWGNEYIHQPSLEQRKLAYKCVEAGVDIIAGHHPHVIQPYEKYKEGHIFYSLGNFCFDNLQSIQTRTGMIASLYWDMQKKMFTNIHLQGIKLSPKILLQPIHTTKFKKYYDSIDRKYLQWKSISDEKYACKYKKVLSIRHPIERILMKLYLIKMLIVLPFSEKRKLIKNLINFYIYKH
ncbi:MAG: CapA family protein [Bacteroidales bacterium]|jgi:poly-gamma-glutamate synthesis protein (capsule biosynthesis protein)